MAAGGNPLAAALAGLLVNARHLPYGLALPDMRPGRGWRRLLGSHVMNDESVVFALAQEDLPRQRAAYWACGLGVLLCWPGAILGALIGGVIGNTDAFGLDAMFPAVILALIVPALRDRVTCAPPWPAPSSRWPPRRSCPPACPCCWPWPGWGLVV